MLDHGSRRPRRRDAAKTARLLTIGAIWLSIGGFVAQADEVLRLRGTFGEDNSALPGNELVITNNSSAGVTIVALNFDLSGADDVVLDPITGPPGTLIDLQGSTGFDGAFQYHDGFVQPDPQPREVFRQLTLEFLDFDPGEEILIVVDADADDGQSSDVDANAFSGAALIVTYWDGTQLLQSTGFFKPCDLLIEISELIPGTGRAVGLEGDFGEDFAAAPGDELTFLNTSAPGVQITSIRLDLNTSNGVVLDPLQPDGQPGQLVDINGSVALDGGFQYSDRFFQPDPEPRDVFRKLRLDFMDFEAGEEVNTLIDVDADSGVEAFVDAAQLAGAALTVDFLDGAEGHQATGVYQLCGALANVSMLVAGPAPAGQVPRLTLARDGGGDLILDWEPSCLASDGDYVVYEGTLGDFSSHDDVTCSTGGATTFTLSPGGGSAYYLIVPRSVSGEGSHGQTSDGSERQRGTSSCLPQALASCS